MKKILGIVALTMIAGVPAFAADTTAIDYVLQIGGSNAGGPGVKFDTTNVVEEGDAGPLYTTDQDIVTWSVAVDVSGYIGEPGLEIYVGGAANLVWDLTLLGPDGQPVGTGGTPFGLGSPTTPGFYSSIMNGTGIFKLQPASFTWEFGDGAPFGRLQDQDLANGANMLQFTFPSTYSYYCNDVTGVTYTTTAQVLAGTGTLMGMGAGYQELDQATGGVERTGVGISDDQGIYMCAQLIGDKAPIAEGQINMAGLPNGTYTLVLTPGEGNNVIWNADNSYVCMIGTTGAFAVKAKNVTGGQLSFVRNAAVLPPPVLQPGVASVKLHGGVAYAIPFIGESVANPGGATSVSVECRNGVTQIALPFDVPVTAVDGSIDAGSEVVVTGGTITSLDLSTPGWILVNMTTANVNGSCVTVTLTNIAAAPGGTPMATTSKSIVVLRGDVTGNGAVDIGDVNAVKALSGGDLNATAVAFRRDVTANGAIDIGDVNNVKSLSGNSFAGTCP